MSSQSVDRHATGVEEPSTPLGDEGEELMEGKPWAGLNRRHEQVRQVRGVGAMLCCGCTKCPDSAAATQRCHTDGDEVSEGESLLFLILSISRAASAGSAVPTR